MTKFALSNYMPIRFAIGFFFRAILSLRYRIEIKGLETLSPKNLANGRGILFLPNHAAHIDNLIFLTYLWPKFRMRPMVSDQYIFYKPLRPFIKLLNALSVPNLKRNVNAYKVKKSKEVLQTVSEGLKNGACFILSPAGQTKIGQEEILRAASGAHAIVTQAPQTNVVLIRATGLWGSSFSRAITGQAPDLNKVILHGVKTVLQNLLFFTPRRKITIELELNPPDLPRSATRLEFNRYLENWYNRYRDDEGNILEKEPLKLVSYSFWRNQTLKITAVDKKNRLREHQVSAETREKIYREIRRVLQSPDLKLSPELSLEKDLGLDSLNIAELSGYLARHFSLREFNLEMFKTVQDVLNAAAGAESDEDLIDLASAEKWPSEADRPIPEATNSQTVPEAFLNICEKMGDRSACRDDTVGILTYKRLRFASLVLSQYFRELPETRVAILLPSSAGALIVYLALQLAGKVPVMLNWSLGARYLEEMVRLSETKTIISSWRFLDRATNVDLGSETDKVLLLEEIRSNLSIKMKLRGTYLASRPVKTILKKLNLKEIDQDHPAVILFTSGSEALPKCVPLSHKNILYTPFAVVKIIKGLRSSDVLFSFLPPFHVFGLVFTTLAPIFLGLKVAFYPNPTDGKALADRIHKWAITIIPCAPTFLKNIFAMAKKNQLSSLRWIFSGAEKAPLDLIEWIRDFDNGIEFMEGYGATECSSIISINVPERPKKEAGLLCPGTELTTIHPETLAPLPPGAEGEICIHGPGVFNGYLGGRASPFLELMGKKWYRTGDLGYLEDGYVALSGRLKRFIKIGGEMISLGAIEESLIQCLQEQGLIDPDVPSLAICSDKNDSRLIAFSVIPLDKDSANEMLKNRGFSNLIKISDVKKVSEIPIMSTGKMNYGKLQELL